MKKARWKYKVQYWARGSEFIGRVIQRNGNVIFTIPGKYNRKATLLRVVGNALGHLPGVVVYEELALDPINDG